MSTSSITARSHRHVLTPWSKQGAINTPTIVRAQGSYLYDSDGGKYLDLSAGLVAVNLGHGHPAVVAAIKEQAEKVCYVAPSMMNDTRSEFAELLSEVSPWDEGARVFFTTGGGEANEDAVKMSRMITGRHKVLVGYRSFHGSAPGAGSLTGEDRRWANEPGMPGVVHFFAPYPYRSPFFTEDEETETQRALEHLETVLTFEGAKNVAALLIEPVVGSNGVIVYPKGYLEGLRRITAEHGIVLIFDEVMTGFGRTGDTFASQRFGVTPDMIVFAKGVASAYIPLGGTLVRESLANYFDDNALMCGHTYSGHPLAMATGLATVKAMKQEGLFQRAKELEPVMQQGLNTIKDNHAVIGDARGIGAFFAIEFVKDKATKEPLVPWYGGDNTPAAKLTGALRKEGVYAFGRYNVMLITPPLTISKSDLEIGFEALDKALRVLA
ncbi:MAG: aminotransferase class III-fold pyridoxal phosphate-dependent enzyme [Trueperaceae bacterium]|nr:aminotransferase class III-fold pyridoxal phosphate-dependent enzyme [Trueperaceae bacterium]